MNVSLRPLEDSDLDAIFEQMKDPESVRMAAFTVDDPADRHAFVVHMSRVRDDPSVVERSSMPTERSPERSRPSASTTGPR